MTSGADVKRQVEEALTAWFDGMPRLLHPNDRKLLDALAPCVVLTREDMPAVVERLLADVGWDTLSDEERQAWCDRLWRSLSPDEEEADAKPKRDPMYDGNSLA